MKVKLIVGATLLALVVAAPVAAKRGFASVTGDIAYHDQTVTMSAQVTRFGTKGSFELTDPGFLHVKGKVDTLIVEGDTATACGVVTESSDPNLLPVGTVFHQYVNDTGGKEQFDRSETIFYAPGAECTPPSVYAAAGKGLVNTAGQWYVHGS